MKRKISLALTLIVFALLISNAAHAQRRVVINLPKYDLAPYHFGFVLAANQMLFTMKPVEGHSLIVWEPTDADDIRVPNTDFFHLYEVTGVPTPGFTIGIVGNLRLGNYFDLRFIPSLAFGERYLDYNIMRYDLNGAHELIPVRKAMASTFTDFPLHIKYRSKRYNNIAAYLLAGGKYSLDLASNKKNEDRNNNLPVRLEQHDFAVDVGVGFDFYTTYFKFGIELKMSYGLFDILIRDGNIYTEGIERINNKIFQLSFTFE